jgi:hypothetical protein
MLGGVNAVAVALGRGSGVVFSVGFVSSSIPGYSPPEQLISFRTDDVAWESPTVCRIKGLTGSVSFDQVQASCLRAWQSDSRETWKETERRLRGLDVPGDALVIYGFAKGSAPIRFLRWRLDYESPEVELARLIERGGSDRLRLLITNHGRLPSSTFFALREVHADLRDQFLATASAAESPLVRDFGARIRDEIKRRRVRIGIAVAIIAAIFLVGLLFYLAANGYL